MNNYKLLIGAVISGVLLSLAWLGVTGIILFIAFVPLLLIENYFSENHHKYKSIVFWGYSLISFIIWNSLTTWWIWNATPEGAVFAIILNSFLMSVVFWIFHAVKRYEGSFTGYAVLVFAWISFEYLHYKWDMSWPWLTLGNGFSNDIRLIQWYEYTGVFGGSLWILIINILTAGLLNKYIKGEGNGDTKIVIALALILSIPVCYSFIRYYTYSEKNDPVNVVIAQPNIDPYKEKFSHMTESQQVSRFLDLCDSLGTPETDFFIGPETVTEEIWEDSYRGNYPIKRVEKFLENKYSNASFVFGSITYKEFVPGMGLPHYVRYNNDSSLIYAIYNSALFVNKDRPIEFYHKSNLVSGVEKMPFSKYLRFLNKLIINLGGTTGTLGTQDEPSVFEKGKTVVGVPICYESGYGEYLSGFVKKGANLLFVITNDGWWKNTPGYKQHLSYSRLRAIELRRSIARSGNTGISCIINQRGEIIKSTKWWEKTSVSGQINRNEKLTFYAKHGDYIARSFVFLLIGVCLYDIQRRVRKK